MVTSDIIPILEALAAGVHPRTREMIEHDVLRDDDVSCALFTAAALLKQTSGNMPNAPVRRPQPAQAGAPWNSDEDTSLCFEYDEGLAIPEIARRHGRTTGAIRSRLAKLGKIAVETVRRHEAPNS